MSLYALIGDPVSHSLSPFIHNFLIKKYNLEGYYTAIKISGTRPELIGDMLEMLSPSGFNVTMPHKKNIIPYLSYLDDEARLYQSVNTVKRDGGSYHGYNTDGKGFLDSLREIDFDLSGKKAVILGSGGVVKTILISLIKSGISSVDLATRTPINLDMAIPDELNHDTIPINNIGIKDFINNSSKLDIDLVINATPLGMHGFNENFDSFSFLNIINPTATVYDLIYNPSETVLLKEAKARGLKVCNGLPMLIWQAFHAFNIFFDIMPNYGDKKELDSNLVSII